MLRRTIGFGLTVGWLWLFFLCGPVITVALKQWPGRLDLYFLFFLFCTALAYLSVGKWKANSVLKNRKKLLIISTIFMSLTSGLICLLPVYGLSFCSRLHWMILPLIALGSFGITVLLFGWMETFLAVSVKQFALTYTGGIVIASILLFGAAVLNFHIGIILVLVLPWLGLLLILQQTQDSTTTDTQVDSKTETQKKPIFPFKLILLIFFFYSVGGLMFKLVGTEYVFTNFFWISNISYMVVVILAGSVIYFVTDLDLRWLYRPVLPLLTIGFILLPFLTGNNAIISFLLLQAGFALFDMYTWLVIVYIARGHGQPLLVLGKGMFWINLAMFGGNLVFTIWATLVPMNRPVNLLALIAGFVTLLAAFIFQDKKETFTGWETRGIPITNTTTGLPVLTNTALINEAQIINPQLSSYEQFIQNHNLTTRETEILILILKGRNNPYITEGLNISQNTLKFHLRNIYRKVGVNNRQEILSLFEDERSSVIPLPEHKVRE